MSGFMYLLKDTGEWEELAEQPYLTEAVLQQFLAAHPSLLGGDQINPQEPRRWILIGREIGIPSVADGSNRWSVDHLFLDQDAIPTFVEVKRSSDTRLRREVVGQMLDYAANGLAHWPPTLMRQKYEERCRSVGEHPEEALRAAISPVVDYESYWKNAGKNLAEGQVRLLFVADRIPAELKQVVEFLNQQLVSAEVLAVELRQYIGNGLRTLVPVVMGNSVISDTVKGRTRAERQWDESSFFAEIATKADEPSVAVARKLLAWATERTTRVWWGKGHQLGSFVPVYSRGGVDYQLFAVWTNGSVEIYFYWYAQRTPFESDELRQEIANRLSAIPGVNLPSDAIHRRPSFPLRVLATEASLYQFLDVYDWYIATVDAHWREREAFA